MGDRYKCIPPGIEHLYPNLPLKIRGITCKGKKIIWMLDNNIYMTSTLGLTGRWTFYLSPKMNNVHLWLLVRLSSGEEKYLYYDDSLKYGNVSFYPNLQSLLVALKPIGPDLLAYAVDLSNNVTPIDEITTESYLKVARGGRIQQKQLCDFLMEQKYFSGIGNYLKAEILYRCKFRPDRTLGSLTDHDIETLRIISLETIYESFSNNGLTIKHYWIPSLSEEEESIDRMGTFPLSVYNRSTDPDGRAVVKDKFADKRMTHWCPDVQV